ncbi:uncharacterized protein [Temnothorax longispinosus]|uniref:uncharacterized protein n=1 Tax=Temnothorax longispinosus TaxID=300112 RepID=UPI003A99A22A
MSRSRVFHNRLTGFSGQERSDKLTIYKQHVWWLIGQDEIADDETKFINLMFGFENARYLSPTQNKLPDGTSIEVVPAENTTAVLKSCTDIAKRDVHGQIYEFGKIPDFQRVKKDGYNKILMEACTMNNQSAASHHVEMMDLDYYVRHRGSIDSYFTMRFSPCDHGRFAATDFNRELFNIPPDKTLILVGPTRMGKTQFALAHFESPIIVRMQEDWKKYQQGVTDGIVLDDIDFCKYPPPILIHTMERETGYTQNVKFSAVLVPADLPKIVCINTMTKFWPRNISSEQKEAVLARVEIHQITKPLFGLRRPAADNMDQVVAVKKLCGEEGE